jgi:hypothetical protein
VSIGSLVFLSKSRHVADNLTGTLPSWYDDLDPDHNYVGVTNDHDYMNVGYYLWMYSKTGINPMSENECVIMVQKRINKY